MRNRYFRRLPRRLSFADPLAVPLAIDVVLRGIQILAALAIAVTPNVLSSPKFIQNFSLVETGGRFMQLSTGLVLPILAIWVVTRPEVRHARR